MQILRKFEGWDLAGTREVTREVGVATREVRPAKWEIRSPKSEISGGFTEVNEGNEGKRPQDCGTSRRKFPDSESGVPVQVIQV